MAIAKLTIDLEARLADFERDLGKAARASQQSADQMANAFGVARAGLVGLATGVASGLSVGAIAHMFMSIVDGLDSLNDLKDATGATIENISALEDVAARTGTSFESMSSALVKFNKVLSDSKAGSETANVLKAIGLNADELKRIDPAEALRQTAVALSKFADDGNKARIIQDLFGKSVQEAAPFLKDLSEQTQLSAKVTAEQAQAAEDFNKQLFSLKKNSTDFARSLVGEVVPALNQLFDEVKKSESGLDRIAAFLKASGFGAGLKLVGIDIFGSSQEKQLASLKEGLEATNKLLDSGNLSEERRLRLLERRKILEDSIKRAEIPQASYSNEGRTHPLKSVGNIPAADSKTKAATSELQKYIDQLEKATLASLDLSKEDEARIEIASGKLGKLTQEQKDYVIELAHGIDVMKETQKVFRDTSSIEDAIALQRELASAIDATPLAKMQRTMQLERALTEAFQNGTHGFDGSAEAAQKYQEALAALHPELDKLKDETNDFAKQAAANIQDSLGETLKRALKGDFDSIEQLWKDMLLNMAAQAAAAKLNQALFGSDFSSTGNLGGILGSIFGAGSSGSGLTATIGGGSAGGYVMPTMAPASAGRTMAAQRTIVIDNSGQTINVGSNVSRAEVLTAIEQKNAQLESNLRRSARQGAL